MTAYVLISHLTPFLFLFFIFFLEKERINWNETSDSFCIDFLFDFKIRWEIYFLIHSFQITIIILNIVDIVITKY